MGCLGCGIFEMWNVSLGSLPGFGMLEMQDFGDVKCPGCGMWDVGFLPGSGMIMYKIPFWKLLLML